MSLEWSILYTVFLYKGEGHDFTREMQRDFKQKRRTLLRRRDPKNSGGTLQTGERRL